LVAAQPRYVFLCGELTAIVKASAVVIPASVTRNNVKTVSTGSQLSLAADTQMQSNFRPA
jgi:hypothetical protein